MACVGVLPTAGFERTTKFMTIDTAGQCGVCGESILQKWIQDGYSQPCTMFIHNNKFVERCPVCGAELENE